MKIMSVFAHPADHFSECGGTIALHTDAGHEVVLLTLTHGGRIHPNAYAEKHREGESRKFTREQIIAGKRREMERAAEILGVRRLINLEYDDNYIGVVPGIVNDIAAAIARERPDVILTDYPLAATLPDPHTVASMMLLNAMNQVSLYLEDLDDQCEYNVKQVFMTKLPVFPRDALSLNGLRNDLFIDISGVVKRKLHALDQFESQGYSGKYARKAIESIDGAFGKQGYVNFAEGYCRLYNETRSLLPVSRHMLENDILTAHRKYSEMDLRGSYPYPIADE